MNMYPDDLDVNCDAPLAPPEWTMAVRHERSPSGRRDTAIIKKAGVPICHISIAAFEGSDEAAHLALATRARRWVADYLTRDHTGSTDFAPLSEF